MCVISPCLHLRVKGVSTKNKNSKSLDTKFARKTCLNLIAVYNILNPAMSFRHGFRATFLTKLCWIYRSSQTLPLKRALGALFFTLLLLCRESLSNWYSSANFRLHSYEYLIYQTQCTLPDSLTSPLRVRSISIINVVSVYILEWA